MASTFVTSRDPVCRTCNLDPLNRLASELKAVADGQATQEAADQVFAQVRTSGVVVDEILAKLGVDPAVLSPAAASAASGAKRLIPVIAT